MRADGVRGFAERRRRARLVRRASERRSSRASSGARMPPLVPGGGVSRWRGVVFVATVAVSVAVALSGAAAFLGLFGGDFDPVGAAAVLLVVASGAAVGYKLSASVSVRVLRGALVGVAMVGVFFFWGYSSQVVVDGRPQLEVSETARAYRLTEELLSDIFLMGSFDELLSYDDATARANLREYDPAADRLEAIAARWATTEIASLPDGRFGPILRHVYTSADFGAQALRAKRTLSLQFDPRTAGDVDSFRATYIAELLSAGPLLLELAREYNFDLVPQEGGLVE